MNGVPHMEVMRSISLYGLSDIILTFEERYRTITLRDRSFLSGSRQATLPTGVTPIPRAAVQPQRPGLSLCARESRSQLRRN